MGFFDIVGFNRFADYFKKSRKDIEDIQSQIKDNSVGLSQEEIMFGNSRNIDAFGASGGMSQIPVEFEQYFYNKASRIAKYREMSRFPEISDALDNICDDAILEDDKGYMIQLALKREIPEHIEEDLRKQWKYIVYDVFNFNQLAWDLFRRWLVDGEIYIELILDEDGEAIIGFKCLPPHTMVPLYDGDKVSGYIQTISHQNANTSSFMDYSYTGQNQDDIQEIEFDKDQIVHVTFGDTGGTKLDTIGFLESTIRTYNQLKNLEDASVIYRLVRAPERRIWNVQVGRMTKAKAEEYIKKLMQSYRKQITYDSSDGSMNSFENIQAMTHDFWFAKNDDDKGTTVETLPGGANLGEMEDVNYFLKKLYTTLKLPSSRWKNTSSEAGSSQYSVGKSGEVTQEEIRFSRFIERLQNKFQYVIIDAYLVQLRLSGIDERYVDSSLFDIKFTKSNLFKEYKELELLTDKFSLLGSIDSYIYKPEENENGYFDPDFVLLNWFNMSKEEYDLNKKLLDARKSAAQEKKEMESLEGEEGTEFGAEDEGEEDVGGFDFGGDEGGAEEPAEESASFKSIDGVNTILFNEFVSNDKYLRSKYEKK